MALDVTICMNKYNVIIWPIAYAKSFTSIFVNSASQNSINFQRQHKFILIANLCDNTVGYLIQRK